MSARTRCSPYASEPLPPRPGRIPAWYGDINVPCYYFELPAMAAPETVGSRRLFVDIEWCGRCVFRVHKRVKTVAVKIPYGARVRAFVVDTSPCGAPGFPGPAISFKATYKRPPRPGRLSVLQIDTVSP